MYHLCPSILAADFNRLGEQIKVVEDAGVKVLHIDVMDGMFVPSISFGMPVIQSIRKESSMFFDCHLMVEDPDRYIQEFVDCGADSITVHVEACKDLPKTIQMIREAGVRAAVAIKPSTPIETVLPVLDQLTFVLIMTVEPGFGGQKYMDICTDKIRNLRSIIQERGLTTGIQVDGGINDETVGIVMEAGANMIVAGSRVFGSKVEEKVTSFLERIHTVESELE